MDMRDIVFQQCLMYAVVAEVESMKAANILHEQHGSDPAYTESDFMRCSNRLIEIAQGLS